MFIVSFQEVFNILFNFFDLFLELSNNFILILHEYFNYTVSVFVYFSFECVNIRLVNIESLCKDFNQVERVHCLKVCESGSELEVLAQSTNFHEKLDGVMLWLKLTVWAHFWQEFC